MAVFKADTVKMISYSEEILNFAKVLDDYYRNTSNVKLDDCLNSEYQFKLNQAIRKVSNSILDEAAKMNSLSNAIRTIAEMYRDTENAILENLNPAAKTNDSTLIIGPGQSIFKDLNNVTDGEESTSADKTGTDKRNWLEKFFDWITRKEPDSYETTTIEQEKAADNRMKNRLWNELQKEKYSQEHWDKASIEERKQILQDYMNAVIVIYNLKDVVVDINWDKKATYTSNKITWGYYTHKTHTVTLNERALADSEGNWDSYDLLETVSHELRHAYQHEAVDHPTRYMVTAETIAIWKDNFAPGHYIKSEDDHTGYLNQPVEKDARDFQVNRDDPRTANVPNQDFFRPI